MNQDVRRRIVKDVFSRIGFGLILIVVASSVLVGLTLGVLNAVNPEVLGNINVTLSISLISLYVVGFAGYFILQKIVPANPNSLAKHSAPMKISPFGIIKLGSVCLGIGFVFNLVTMGLNLIKNLPSNLIEAYRETQEYLERGYGTPDPPTFIELDPLMDMIGELNPFLILIFIVVITSVFEEYLFRKLLYDKLIVFGGGVFVFMSALLFALFHMNTHQFLYTFGIGLVLGGVMYFTGKVSYCIVLHMFFNFFGTGAIHIGGINEMALGLYSIIHLIIAIYGIVIGVKWLIKYGFRVKFAAPEIPIDNFKDIVLNAGMIVFIGICVVLTVLP